MKTLEDIRAELRRLGPVLGRDYPVRVVGVFGSYARGEQTDTSDLDILVDCDAPVGFLTLAGLQQDLSDALGIKVDVMIRQQPPSPVGRRIAAELVPL
ncbi:MAG: nucleotidyltransferase family protein [Rhodospirillales bacterium]|nr:nucleotidyltransferase family protein [Rhodospirillales bacterium]